MARTGGLGGSPMRPAPVPTKGVGYVGRPLPPPRSDGALAPGKADPGLQQSPETDPGSPYYVDPSPVAVVPEVQQPPDLKPGKPAPGLQESPEPEEGGDVEVQQSAPTAGDFALLGIISFAALVSIFLYGREP